MNKHLKAFTEDGKLNVYLKRRRQTRATSKVRLIMGFSIGLLIIGGLLMLRTDNGMFDIFSNRVEDNHPYHVLVDGIRVNTDVAKTQEEKNKGFSKRTKLAENEGLLFIYDKADLYSVEVNETNFPIEIIWIDEKFTVVDITRNLGSVSFSQIVKPQKPITYVL